MKSLENTIQRIGGTDYPIGYSAPETTQFQAEPEGGSDGTVTTLVLGNEHSDFAEPTRVRPTRENTPHNGGWWPHDQMQVGAFRESVIGIEVADGVTVALDPDQASIYEIVMDGSITVELDNPVALPQPLVRSAYMLTYAASVLVFLHRQAGGLVTWPSNIYWNPAVDQDAVYLAPTAARTDVFLFVFMPGAGSPYWAGFNPALGLTQAANLTSSSGAAAQTSSSGTSGS